MPDKLMDSREMSDVTRLAAELLYDRLDMTAKHRVKNRVWVFKPLLVVSMISATAIAAEKGPTIHVQSLDPNLDVSSLQQPGVEAHGYEELHSKAPKSDALPSRAQREKVLKQAGLSDDVRKMDELDRDMLYMSAKRLQIAELSKKYPNLPPKKLAELSKLLRKKTGGAK